MLLQIVRGPFPPILPCELFFGQPSIKGADAYKFHKQYIGRDLDGMELPKWVFLVARMDMKILLLVEFLVLTSVIMMS